MKRNRLLARFAVLSVAALACATAPSRKDREASDIHYQLGAEALQQGRHEDALREFDQSLRFNERNGDAYLGRGSAYLSFGKMTEAERDYRRAIEVLGEKHGAEQGPAGPELSQAHNALGQLLARTGRLEQAIAEFDLAIGNDLYREAYVARYNKGLALYNLGRHQESIVELRACLALAPRFCAGHRELGRIELGEGKVKEALESFTRYTEICGKVADAWLQLGLAEMKAGDTERAREAFETCAKLPGENENADECRRKIKVLQ
ncbi:MAG TPA: tetratricopeptide repeat protein [Anaeromyxobacteraceae bacterium]|nr:tetratricopeptide repeat protein [Anaeromyxobacteraceae bacterium]